MKVRLAAGAAIVALMFFAPPALAEEAGASPPGPSAPAASAATSPSPAVTSEVPPAPSRRTVWPWVLMGTGVALVVTATVLEINSVHEDDQREAAEVKLNDYATRPATDPEKKQLQASVDDHQKSASKERTAALIVGTVGFLTIAGSVVLWFFEGSASSSAAPAPVAKHKPSLTPSFGPGYAGASLGASF